MQKNFNSLNFFKIVFVFCILLQTSSADAATLSFSPSSSTVSEGNIVSIKVTTNTLGKSVNNAEATIQFPTDLLEVISVNKNSSIFSLWVEEPKFSNATGTVSFNGGVSNPGYTGSNGTLATITFKAKKSGVATVLFADAAVRENDGLGTDILSGRGTSVINISSTNEPEKTPPVQPPKNTVPAKPTVTSETHPDETLWYSVNTASFNWKVPSGISSIQAVTNRIPDAVPATSYDNSVTQKTLTELPDGTFYFHIRYANGNGWSPITHYKIRVDTTAPEPFTPTIKTLGDQNVITLDAEDKMSGVDYYTLLIDGTTTLTIKKSELLNSEYTLPAQNEGNHSVLVTAYDKAGNHTEATVTFRGNLITAPTITLSSSEIKKGESVIITGKSDYPNKQVEIILESKGSVLKKYLQTISFDGTFSVTTDAIKSIGTVTVSARNILSESVMSASSENVYLKVQKSEITRISVTIFWVILALALGLILLIILYIGWHKFLALRKRNKNTLERAIEDAHKAMSLLKDELSDQLIELEKMRVDRELNASEEIVFKEIQKNIDDVDKFIEKKLKKLL